MREKRGGLVGKRTKKEEFRKRGRRWYGRKGEKRETEKRKWNDMEVREERRTREGKHNKGK